MATIMFLSPRENISKKGSEGSHLSVDISRLDRFGIIPTTVTAKCYIFIDNPLCQRLPMLLKTMKPV